ncbi:MAG: YhjD/YihY/BrkB family envelope integrity protein [Candidatus Binatia bacterium]
MEVRKLLHRWMEFLGEEIWKDGIERASRMRAGIVTVVRVAVITAEGFWNDLCMLRASALTYSSLLALVPVLALAFAILRGLGWHGDRLAKLILEKVTVLTPTAVETIVRYVDNTNVSALGAVGGAVLLLTFISVMANIESSFNAIWGNVGQRSLSRKISDYFGVMVVAPVLLALATSLTAGLQNNAMFGWLRGAVPLGSAVNLLMALSAWFTVWLLFGLILMFMPNTRVRVLPALIGGVVAGTLWQGTQWAYIAFQVGVARYNAIYGALAQLPILIVWIYLSWMILLFGAELSFAVQNLSLYSHDRGTAAGGYAFRELLGLSIMARLSAAATGDDDSPTLEDLARELDAPLRELRELLTAFGVAGLVHWGGEGGERCFLSLAPQSIELSEVIRVLRGEQRGEASTQAADRERGVEATIAMLARARTRTLGQATVADLA